MAILTFSLEELVNGSYSTCYLAFFFLLFVTSSASVPGIDDPRQLTILSRQNTTLVKFLFPNQNLNNFPQQFFSKNLLLFL